MNNKKDNRGAAVLRAPPPTSGLQNLFPDLSLCFHDHQSCGKNGEYHPEYSPATVRSRPKLFQRLSWRRPWQRVPPDGNQLIAPPLSSPEWHPHQVDYWPLTQGGPMDTLLLKHGVSYDQTVTDTELHHQNSAGIQVRGRSYKFSWDPSGGSKKLIIFFCVTIWL